MTVHPWETGRDNAPAWDDALARVPRATRPYRRRDTDHVDCRQRPTQDFYDRVVHLMDFMREANFDPEVIARECPFRIVDAAIVFILHRATKDLLALADELSLAIDRGRRWPPPWRAPKPPRRGCGATRSACSPTSTS